MIKNLFSLKNRLTGIYESPAAEVCDPKDYLEQLTAGLAGCEVPVLNRYKEFDAYILGTLDTKSGEIKVGIEFVGSLEQLCLGLINAKEKKEDVRSEESC